VIAWQTLYPALLGLFGHLASGDDTYVAEDRDRPRKLMSDTRKFTLAVRVLSVIGIGEDEERVEFIPPGTTGPDAPWANQLRSTITGQRRITLQLEADAIENTDVGWAWMHIERIRTGMQRQSSLAALAAADAALIRVGNAVQANFVHAGRMHSRVLLDIQIGAVVNDVDPAPVGWIQTVEITGHTQDTSGAELPHPPNLTDHIITSP